MKTTFGEYIRSLRHKSKYTLTQLAAKLDLDSANLSKIENGKRDFDEKRLEKLAQVFRLNLDELRNEFLSDRLAKQMYKIDCTEQLLKAAEEKAEYRRNLIKKHYTENI